MDTFALLLWCYLYWAVAGANEGSSFWAVLQLRFAQVKKVVGEMQITSHTTMLW